MLHVSVEEAVVDVLVTKALRACKQYTCKTISLSGGVAANKRLRATLKSKCVENDLDFIVPDFRLCTDNAEMIAIASYFKLRNGYAPVPYSQVRANSAWEL
jgi:N6-L-threonylcarbamoyladenine synthase